MARRVLPVCRESCNGGACGVASTARKQGTGRQSLPVFLSRAGAGTQDCGSPYDSASIATRHTVKLREAGLGGIGWCIKWSRLSRKPIRTGPSSHSPAGLAANIQLCRRAKTGKKGYHKPEQLCYAERLSHTIVLGARTHDWNVTGTGRRLCMKQHGQSPMCAMHQESADFVLETHQDSRTTTLWARHHKVPERRPVWPVSARCHLHSRSWPAPSPPLQMPHR